MKPERIVISIGNLAIGFILRNSRMAKQVRLRYSQYLHPARKPALWINCNVNRKCIDAGEEVRITGRNDTHWQARRRDFECEWNLNEGDARVWPSVYSFDALIRVLYSMYGIHRNAVMLHAAAVVNKGKAFVFAGPSGSGKSTITGLLNMPVTLNDEICICCHDGKNGIRVGGTPFWGELGCGKAYPRTYPVQGIYFLEKDRKTMLVDIPPASRISRLLPCICFFGRDSGEMQRVLDIGLDILEHIPAYNLHFVKDSLVGDFLFSGT